MRKSTIVVKREGCWKDHRFLRLKLLLMMYKTICRWFYKHDFHNNGIKCKCFKRKAYNYFFSKSIVWKLSKVWLLFFLFQWIHSALFCVWLSIKTRSERHVQSIGIGDLFPQTLTRDREQRIYHVYTCTQMHAIFHIVIHYRPFLAAL